MKGLTEYTPEELEKFWINLVLAIHTEFCVRGRTQVEFEAGWDVIQEIGGRYKAKQD